MAFADASRVLLLVAMAMAFGSTWVLVIGVVAERSIGQLYEPASAALVPNIVGTVDELTSANATFSASGAVVRLVGAPLGGALLAVLGLRAVLLLDAASFAVSLGAVVALRWRSTPSIVLTTSRSTRSDRRVVCFESNFPVKKPATATSRSGTPSNA
jgi:MFS family permease